MRIAEGTSRVALARTSGSTLGSRCLVIWCQCPAPSALARSRYGRDCTVSVWARTSRVVPGQETRAITVMVVAMLRPSTASSAMATTRLGSTMNQSERRRAIQPYQPPMWPPVMPTVVPMTMATTVAVTPMTSDSREPQRVSSQDRAAGLVGAERVLGARRGHAPAGGLRDAERGLVDEDGRGDREDHDGAQEDQAPMPVFWLR